MLDERRLVSRIRQGDRDAFSRFLDRCGPQVQRLTRRYVENCSDAEDVLQDIFCDIYRSIGAFRGDCALSTWVYRVAVNHCLKYRQRRLPDGVPYDDALAQEADWRADPAHAAETHEMGDRVRSAMQLLSPIHYDVVVLCELHGLTYQECAQVLSIPVGTVKSRLSNAFRRLRELLGGYVSEVNGPLRTEVAGEVAR